MATHVLRKGPSERHPTFKDDAEKRQHANERLPKDSVGNNPATREGKIKIISRENTGGVREYITKRGGRRVRFSSLGQIRRVEGSPHRKIKKVRERGRMQVRWKT